MDVMFENLLKIKVVVSALKQVEADNKFVVSMIQVLYLWAGKGSVDHMFTYKVGTTWWQKDTTVYTHVPRLVIRG